MALTIQTASSGALRDAHYALNPVTSLYEQTTLLEGQRANGWTYSEQIDNAAWSKTAVTVTANAALAPDGTTTADKLVEDAVTNVHRISRATGTITDNTSQSAAFYAKAAERGWLCILTVNKASTAELSWVNLSTGAVGAQAAGHAIRVLDAGNGWWRIACTFDSGTGASTPTVYLEIATGDNASRSYAGDGVSGLYLWGLQFEADAPFASSYIPTTASAVTRSADSFSLPFTAAPQEMTLYARFVEQGTISISSARLVQVGDAADADARLLISQAGGFYEMSHDSGSTSVSSTLAAAPAIGDLVELRAVLFADGAVQLHQSINGAAETSAAKSAANALAVAWSDDLIWLNSVGSAFVGFNAFTHLSALPGVKTQAECRSASGVS